MKPMTSDAEDALIDAAVAAAPALTTDQITELRRLLNPGPFAAKSATRVSLGADNGQRRAA